MTDKKVPHPDLLLCFSLYAATHSLMRVYREALKPHGITYPQFLVINALSHSGAMTVASLGRDLGLDSGTLSPLLKRLEATGLITRERSKQDERVVQIELTAEGEDRAIEMKSVPDIVGEATGFDTPRIEQLRDEVKALRENLDNSTQKKA